MKVSEVFETARALIAGGWHEPYSLDAGGKLCAASDEGIARFCVDDALRVAVGYRLDDAVTITAAELELQQQLRLTGESSSLTTWLSSPTRTSGDVVSLFARAVAHARAGESR